MKKTIILLALVWGCLSGFAQYTLDDQIYDYIDAYKDLAMQEMELYRVPASITLAQAIYSSRAGTNRVSREANNHLVLPATAQNGKGRPTMRLTTTAMTIASANTPLWRNLTAITPFSCLCAAVTSNSSIIQ